MDPLTNFTFTGKRMQAQPDSVKHVLDLEMRMAFIGREEQVVLLTPKKRMTG